MRVRRYDIGFVEHNRNTMQRLLRGLSTTALAFIQTVAGAALDSALRLCDKSVGDLATCADETCARVGLDGGFASFWLSVAGIGAVPCWVMVLLVRRCRRVDVTPPVERY